MVPTTHAHVTVSQRVAELTRDFVRYWWETDAGPRRFKHTYNTADHAANERSLEYIVRQLLADLDRVPTIPSEQASFQDRVLLVAREFGASVLGFDRQHLDFLIDLGFPSAIGDFADAARQFDPSLKDQDIYQAGRNAVTMNLLQALFGLTVQLTPAILAYSLLYPYTDNYVDDPKIPTETKHQFAESLRWRLEGKQVAAANAHEDAIYRLIGLIEHQFPRSQSANVFASLLAIHTAQSRSAALLRMKASPFEVDVLGISVEKGGAAVLADGYLLAETLTAAQQEFLFAYGVFTQLMDDLDDHIEDRQTGQQSIFALTSQHWQLDAITNRTFRLGDKVLECLAAFGSSSVVPIRALLSQSFDWLLIDAVGRAPASFNRAYSVHLEACLPFRYRFLKKQRRRVAWQQALMRLARIFHCR